MFVFFRKVYICSESLKCYFVKCNLELFKAQMFSPDFDFHIYAYAHFYSVIFSDLKHNAPFVCNVFLITWWINLIFHTFSSDLTHMLVFFRKVYICSESLKCCFVKCTLELFKAQMLFSTRFYFHRLCVRAVSQCNFQRRKAPHCLFGHIENTLTTDRVAINALVNPTV